jgi:hypothetical protein
MDNYDDSNAIKGNLSKTLTYSEVLIELKADYKILPR